MAKNLNPEGSASRFITVLSVHSDAFQVIV